MQVPPSLVGISFDGLAISGVVNELLNVATIFRDAAYRILIDLGGDITHRPELPIDTGAMPAWVQCVRVIGSDVPRAYGAALVDQAKEIALRGQPIAGVDRYTAVCHDLASAIVATMERGSTRILIVENGTLPDNPLFTEALYLAIEQYGTKHGLGKYVLWRDHDLMWSTEPRVYGRFPYPGVRRPIANAYIHYCVATDWMRRRFEAWARVPCQVISNRFSPPGRDDQRPTPPLRDAYSIPGNAILIARCCRVIPQKSIERDLRLVDVLQRRLANSADPRRVYLFVTGPTSEDPAEYRRLVDLAQILGIERQVIWADGLSPFNASFASRSAGRNPYSVADLLSAADVSSFLTTYDYEGFGNPPGEAMAFGIPYVATSYELYHDVYGSKGAVAPILPIWRDSPRDEPIPDEFTDWVLRLLTNREYREQVVAKNRRVYERFFPFAALGNQLRELFGERILPL